MQSSLSLALLVAAASLARANPMALTAAADDCGTTAPICAPTSTSTLPVPCPEATSCGYLTCSYPVATVTTTPLCPCPDQVTTTVLASCSGPCPTCPTDTVTATPTCASYYG